MADENNANSTSYRGKVDNVSTIGGSIRNGKTYSGAIHGATIVNPDGYDGVDTDTATTTVSNKKHTITVDVNTNVIATKKYVSGNFETQAAATEMAAQLDNKINSTKADLQTEIEDGLSGLEESTNDAIDSAKGEINQRIDDLADATGESIGSLREELSGDIVSAKTELQNSIDDLSTDMSREDTEIKNSISTLRTDTAQAISEAADAAESAISSAKTELTTQMTESITQLETTVADNKTEVETALSTSITNLDSKIQNDLTLLHQRITIEIEESISHTDCRKHANEQSDIEWEVIDNSQIIFTNEVTSLNLVIPQTVEYGFISMVTLVHMDTNKNITVDNRSSYNTRIVTGTTRIPGAAYVTSISGKKIIFARCDGIDLEILIIEEQEG